MNNKIGIKIKLPIKYSNNIRYRIIKSVRFWSSNIIKVNWDDSSVVYYKIFLSQEDFDKNIEKNLDKFSRIIYWNALGKEIEKNFSWDYNST